MEPPWRCNRAGTVGFFKSLEVPALDDAGVALTFAGAGDVDLVAVCKDVSLDEVAYVVSAAIVSNLNSCRVFFGATSPF